MVNKSPLECKTEEDFVGIVQGTGCMCLKLNPLGRVGIPDRLVLGHNQFVLFVELKRLGEEPRPIQNWFHNQLKNFGFPVMVPDNIEDAVEGFVIHLKAHMKKHG